MARALLNRRSSLESNDKEESGKDLSNLLFQNFSSLYSGYIINPDGTFFLLELATIVRSFNYSIFNSGTRIWSCIIL